jgi:hypothetical protein
MEQGQAGQGRVGRFCKKSIPNNLLLDSSGQLVQACQQQQNSLKNSMKK